MAPLLYSRFHMRTSHGALMFAVLLASSFVFGATAHDGVIELTTGTLDNAVDGKRVLLELYTTWCTHCRKFESSYVRVASALAVDRVLVARVDGSANRMVTNRFKVTGFPSFYYLENGKVWEYTGDRTVEALVEFAKSRGHHKGKEIGGITAPFGPYWKFTAHLVDVLQRSIAFVHEKNISTGTLIGVLALSFVSVLTLFAVCIHFATKPSSKTKRS